jgi:hypothetical protein
MRPAKKQRKNANSRVIAAAIQRVQTAAAQKRARGETSEPVLRKESKSMEGSSKGALNRVVAKYPMLKGLAKYLT